MSVHSTVAALMREMRQCAHQPELACRAAALLPRALPGEGRRGLLSDHTLTGLARAAQLVQSCAWRKECRCGVAGRFGECVLAASGELDMPRLGAAAE